MTTAKALVELLKVYPIGGSFEPLVEMARDLASEVHETYVFEDGSSLILVQDERDKKGYFQRIEVLTGDDKESEEEDKGE